jgi:hypothetical protein
MMSLTSVSSQCDNDVTDISIIKVWQWHQWRCYFNHPFHERKSLVHPLHLRERNFRRWVHQAEIVPNFRVDIIYFFINFLQTSYLFLTNFLSISYKHLIYFLSISYKIIIYFFQNSYQFITIFLRVSYQFLINFLQTYEHFMNSCKLFSML